MDFIDISWLSSLAIIVAIDLVLAGDNAVVIAMAARDLPAHLQRKAIFWGAFLAITIRASLTLVIVWLLNIPWLKGIGALILLWISYKIMDISSDGEKSADMKGKKGFLSAMSTIAIADVAMGFDNMLAVAGASDGDYVLVVLGLLISIPLIVWGSVIILGWLKKWPALSYAGGGLLAFVAAQMLVSEPKIDSLLESNNIHYALIWTFLVAVPTVIMLCGWRRNLAQKRRASSEAKPI